MQLVVRLDIEYAVIRVLTGDSPQMAPLALVLQLLRKRLLLGLQAIDERLVGIGRNLNLHMNQIQHSNFSIE